MSRYYGLCANKDGTWGNVLVTYPHKKTSLPEAWTKIIIGNKIYEWKETCAENLNNLEIRKVLDSLKEDEAIELGQVYFYKRGSSIFRLGKTDITPRYIPDDAVKMPNNMLVATQELSEKSTIASVQKFIDRIEGK